MLTLPALTLVLSSVLLACNVEAELVPQRMEGDVEELVSTLETDEMPARAEAFLATDRPWRAAVVMRRYLELVGDPPAEHVVLAARAEGGWGEWAEVQRLLEGMPALDTHSNGLALYLLARGRDATGDAPGAVEAYRAFLALSPPAGELELERSAARLRLGLALIRAGDREGARRELALATEDAGIASMWVDLLEADALAEVGDVAAVTQKVARFDSGIPGLRAWRARVTAARRAGDLAQARRLANEAREWARTSATRAEFLVTAGRIAIDMGDVDAGRAAMRSAIALGTAGPAAREAADVLRRGSLSVSEHLAVARVYRAQGLHEESLEGYRRWLDAAAGTPAQRSEVRMEYANALLWAQRYDDVVEALQPIEAQTEARMLMARAEALRSNFDRAAGIYTALAERGAGPNGGVQALYLAADVRHHEQDFARARELYDRVVRRHPGSGQAGLAMMRLAGIAYHGEEFAAAARLWDDYRTRFPRGTHALQATYWAGRARLAMGDETGANALFRSVRQRDRSSYYAVLASEHLGDPFWPLPMGASPGADAAAERRVAGWMRGVDLLREAGFQDDASAQVNRVLDQAGSDRHTLYALAEALAERGYSQRAIRIGLQLERTEPQNRRLLRILYPFSYRTLITEEARDRELDPFVLAALIRQESMFEARITSPAGARGLMQIMPATGRALAEAVELEPWDDELLYHPEINVHLGTRYVARHWENYDGSLPAVFAAYNAGWHRVEWWSSFPEYGRDELFTERIPFRETRDYVKILTRNLAMYRGLYGEDG